MDSLQPEQQKVILHFILNLVASDVEDGLAGRDHGGFFEPIDSLYKQANQSKCYFCSKCDGNEFGFNEDTHLCLTCQAKVKNIARFIREGDWSDRGKDKRLS